MISYLLYCFGIIGFVCSLVKTFYRLQFFMFGWTHCTLLIIVVQRKKDRNSTFYIIDTKCKSNIFNFHPFLSHLCMQNIFDGVIWFALPVLLVCSNDTFAYIVGFFFGKRFIQQPLTNLSVSLTRPLQTKTTIVSRKF